MKIFALFMSGLYIIAGSLFLFTDTLSNVIQRYRPVLGVVLVGYGALRFFLWKRKASGQGTPEA